VLRARVVEIIMVLLVFIDFLVCLFRTHLWTPFITMDVMQTEFVLHMIAFKTVIFLIVTVEYFNRFNLCIIKFVLAFLLNATFCLALRRRFILYLVKCDFIL
jgi:hypothetical protein